MVSRLLQRRASTPVQAATTRSTPSLPGDLLVQTCRRIWAVGLTVSGLWTFGILMNVLVAPLAGQVPMMNMGWPMPGLPLMLLGLAASLLLAYLAGRFSSKPDLLLDIGSAFLVLTCLLVGLHEYWHPLLEIPRLSFIALVIVVYASIVPNRPGTTLGTGLIAASMGPLALLVSGMRGLDIQASVFFYIASFAPNYLAAVLAVIPARIIHGLGRQVKRARELGSYRLDEELGKGGMGEVYRASHQMLARPAAVKLIRPEVLGGSTPGTARVILERFRREAEAAALLRSPHTISLYDFGAAHDGTFFFVMELLEGIDLESLVERFGPLPPERAVHLLKQACHSLEEAHARGLIHRDIKPSNIFSCRMGLEVDFVKVLDFGLVKDTADGQDSLRLTAPDAAAGTPAYIAPELVRGDGEGGLPGGPLRPGLRRPLAGDGPAGVRRPQRASADVPARPRRTSPALQEDRAAHPGRLRRGGPRLSRQAAGGSAQERGRGGAAALRQPERRGVDQRAGGALVGASPPGAGPSDPHDLRHYPDQGIRRRGGRRRSRGREHPGMSRGLALLLCLGVTAPLSGQRPTGSTLGGLSGALQEVAARIGPSVVQIRVTVYRPDEEGAGLPATRRSSGSGVILSADGYIVTNAHVVQGGRRFIVVVPRPAATGAPGRSAVRSASLEVSARLVGSDRETDLAVLKVDLADLVPASFGDSDSLAPGQVVLAFGSPLGLANSVSMGVVSAVGRQLRHEDQMVYIQTDTPINPGNSGGPLVDAQGRVVGINTLILSQSGGSEGIGFAVPSNIVRSVYEQIRTHRRVRRGEIGVFAQSITPPLAASLRLARDWGVILGDVYPNGPAAKAGLRPGDVILSVDGKPMENGRQFDVTLYRRNAGEQVVLEVGRGLQRLTARVPVVERRGDPAQLGDLVSPERNLVPRLGVLGLDLTEELAQFLPGLREMRGVVVAAVADPAGPGGLEPGDVILELNGSAMRTLLEVRNALDRLPVTETAVLHVNRQGQLRYVTVPPE